MDEVAAVYAKDADALTRFAASLVGPTDAADVVSKAVLDVLKARPDHVRNLRAYLYRAVANEAKSHWRSHQRRRRRDTLAASSQTSTEPPEVAGLVAEFSVLSPQQRAVVHLTYWEDLTPAVVASRLGVSEGTVRRQLARARKKLSEVLS